MVASGMLWAKTPVTALMAASNRTRVRSVARMPRKTRLPAEPFRLEGRTCCWGAGARLTRSRFELRMAGPTSGSSSGSSSFSALKLTVLPVRVALASSVFWMVSREGAAISSAKSSSSSGEAAGSRTTGSSSSISSSVSLMVSAWETSRMFWFSMVRATICSLRAAISSAYCVFSSLSPLTSSSRMPETWIFFSFFAKVTQSL